jgi:hypothetical protein
VSDLTGLIAVGIPFAAVVLGIGTGMLKVFLSSQERRLEMKLRLKQDMDTSVKQQIEALRADMAGLRDTSTQYDMSLQRTLEGIDARVQSLERARQAHPTATVRHQDDQVQRIGH